MEKNEFIHSLEKIGKEKGFKCKKFISLRRSTNNIIELSGDINCLIYFHFISKKPYRWGVTKTRIEELQNSGKTWFIILFYESPNSGYLLQTGDVERYINQNLWPMGRGKNKNEYKIRPGEPLKFNNPFHTFEDLIKGF